MKKILLFVSLFVLLLTSCKVSPGPNPTPNIKKYTISFDSNGGSEVVEQIVEEGNLAIEPKDPIKENYDFICWEYKNERFDFNTPVKSNITLVAKWEEKDIHEHNLIYHGKKEPTCTEIGCEEYVECSECTYSTYKELPALDHDLTTHEAKEPTDKEVGWKEYVTCSRCEYNTYEELPIIEVERAELEVYEENGYRYINYGSYPQTHVNDEKLLAKLNNLTQINKRGYYEFEGKEYAKVETKHSRYGAVEETDIYGKVVSVLYPYKYSSGKIIMEYRTIEWFKVEPIKWRILSIENNKYQVLSEYLLTAQEYYKDSYYRQIDGVDIAPNNYKYSDIRSFLNNEFINSAFTIEQQNTLITTEVDNSASTIYSSSNPNEFVCENTFDKIYLLSYKDSKNRNFGFIDDKSRQAKVTDYAKATGAFWSTSAEYLDCYFWWLRSPYYNNYSKVYYVSGNDYTFSNSDIDSSYGVRPAMVIALNSIN